MPTLEQLLDNFTAIFAWFLLISTAITGIKIWARQKFVFPKTIHFLALGMLLIGAVGVLIYAVNGILTLHVAMSFLTLPPFAMYAGWLLFGGPKFRQEEETRTKQNINTELSDKLQP